MKMHEKIELGRVKAQAALDAYRAAHDPMGRASDDDGEALCDLIADLFHLADARLPEHPAALAARALDHFENEIDPDNADTEV